MTYEQKAKRETDKLTAMMAMGVTQASYNKIFNLRVGDELADYKNLLAEAGRKYKPLLAKLSQRNANPEITKKDLDFILLASKKMEGALYCQAAKQLSGTPGATSAKNATNLGVSMTGLVQQYNSLWNTTDLETASKLLSAIKATVAKIREISKAIKSTKPDPEDIIGNLANEIKQRRFGN
jgi:hypothetical protein